MSICTAQIARRVESGGEQTDKQLQNLLNRWNTSELKMNFSKLLLPESKVPLGTKSLCIWFEWSNIFPPRCWHYYFYEQASSSSSRCSVFFKFEQQTNYVTRILKNWKIFSCSCRFVLKRGGLRVASHFVKKIILFSKKLSISINCNKSALSRNLCSYYSNQ